MPAVEILLVVGPPTAVTTLNRNNKRLVDVTASALGSRVLVYGIVVRVHRGSAVTLTCVVAVSYSQRYHVLAIIQRGGCRDANSRLLMQCLLSAIQLLTEVVPQCTRFRWVPAVETPSRRGREYWACFIGFLCGQ